VVVLDDNNTVSIGSRSVCYVKRLPEIWDRQAETAPFARTGAGGLAAQAAR